MLFSMYIIKDRMNKLNNILKNIKENQEDLTSEKGKINGLIYDMKLAINEYKITTQNNNLNINNRYLSEFLQEVYDAKDGESLKFIIVKYYSLLEEIDLDYDCWSEGGNVEYINENIMLNVAEHINNNNRPFNVFDTACKNGGLINKIKTIKNNAILYGLESNNLVAEQAKTILDRVIKGTLKGSRISNDVFDMIVCKPEIYTKLEDNMSIGAISKPEKNFIYSNLRYLRNDGIFFMSIPYYRLHKDICILISRLFKNVHVIQGINNDYEKGIVYLIAQKDANRIYDENIYEKLRKCYNYDNVDNLTDVKFNTFNLPNKLNNIDLFKGSVIDTDELLNIVTTSGCTDAFFEKQKVRKISENIIQPLLPFNVGQIGLVLTSGCLDGVIDEGDGHFHLVKGRVSKKSETVKSYETGTVTEVETISNKVEINVILPSGEFKTLT